MAKLKKLLEVAPTSLSHVKFYHLMYLAWFGKTFKLVTWMFLYLNIRVHDLKFILSEGLLNIPSFSIFGFCYNFFFTFQLCFLYNQIL